METTEQVMARYLICGKIVGVADSYVREEIKHLRHDQTLFIERHWCGGHGRAYVADNGSQDYRECIDLCKRSGRWYLLVEGNPPQEGSRDRI